MKKQSTEWYAYDEMSDVLEVYFGEKRAAWTTDYLNDT